MTGFNQSTFINMERQKLYLCLFVRLIFVQVHIFKNDREIPTIARFLVRRNFISTLTAAGEATLGICTCSSLTPAVTIMSI